MLWLKHVCTFVVILSFGCASVPGALTSNPMDSGIDSRASLLDRANIDVPLQATDSQTLDSHATDTSTRDVAVVDSATTPDVRIDAVVAADSALPPSDIGDALAVLGAANAQAVDSLYYRIAVSSGWPMKEESRWLFVTRWPNAPGPVFWTSMLNQWDVGNRPASRVQGTDFYFVILNPNEFIGDARGAKYKWFSNGTYRAPPEARAYGEDENGEFGYASAPTGVRYLERMPDFRSAFLTPTRTVRISVPANYVSQITRRVLVMHDGQNLFTTTDVPWGGWRVHDALASNFADVLVVGIDNASDRFGAYAHVSDTEESIGTQGGQAPQYLQMVRDEVLPLIRERYGVGTDRARYAVAGSSLGGLVSVYFADAGAATFGYAIAMSSTLGWGAYNGTNSSNAFARSWTHMPTGIYTKMYIDSGGAGPCTDRDNDGVMEDARDSDNFCVTQQFVARLMGLGYQSGTHYVYTVAAGAQHNEAAWAARLPGALNALASMGW